MTHVCRITAVGGDVAGRGGAYLTDCGAMFARPPYNFRKYCTHCGGELVLAGNGEMVDREIYQECLRLFGENAQLQKAIEECSELIVALCHLGRNRADTSQVIEKIADVEIMVDQLRMIFGERRVHKAKRMKLRSLADLVREKKETRKA